MHSPSALHVLPSSAATATAAADAQVFADGNPPPCLQGRRGEGRAGEAIDGDARRSALSEMRGEGTRQPPCTCCVGVLDDGNRREAGMGVGGGVVQGMTAAGRGVGDRGVVEREGDSRLHHECETLRIVVGALREKDKHSQASAVLRAPCTVRCCCWE